MNISVFFDSIELLHLLFYVLLNTECTFYFTISILPVSLWTEVIVVRTQFYLFDANFEMFYYQVYLTPGLSERADHLVQPF